MNWVWTGSDSGAGKKGTVVFIHGAGLDLTYWDRQIEALEPEYDVAAFDLPGHGRSEMGNQPWSFDGFAAITAGLIEQVGGGPVHLVGISFGGMIAQATVLARPELIRSLILIATASTFPDTARAGMLARAEAVRTGGMGAVLQSSLERWFTPETRRRRPDRIDRVAKTVLSDDPAAHAAVWETVATFDVHHRLGEIRCPTLILVGEDDPSTPPASGAVLQAAIAGSIMVTLPDTSHMANIESPLAVNRELLRFLAAH